MKQQESGSSDALKATPQGPIIVLGQKDYLFVGRTVKETVEETRPSAGGGGHAGAGRPASQPLDELNFFDSTGQPLEPVVTDGQLEDLEAKDLRKEIRDRIEKMFRAGEQELRAANINPDEVPLGRLLRDAVSPEDFIQQLADKIETIKALDSMSGTPAIASESLMGCSIWDRMCGRC